MSDLTTRAAVKAIFQTGDPLNQSAFVDLIDSLAINTEVGAKANSASPTFTGTVVLPSTTSVGDVSATELAYVNGVTSAIQTQIDAKESKVRPIIADSGLEVSHVYFSSTGLVDTVTGNQAKWTAANTPPLTKRPLPQYAGAVARQKVGKPFTTSNYFTCGTSLLNFPTAPWTAAVEYDFISSGANDIIIACLGAGTEGWCIMTNPGTGPYLLNGGFAGPQLTGIGNSSEIGRATLIFGWDGTDFIIKMNGGKPVRLATAYTVPTGATGYIGRYSGGFPFSGGIYEAWGSTDTPSEASMDTLYRASRLEKGNDYRFPRTATTRFHFHAKDFASNTWKHKPFAYETPDPTLTTVGTVPVATESVDADSGDGRWVIGPAGHPAVLTADTAMYYLTYANNFLDFSTSFHGAMVVIPESTGLDTTQIFLASGWSTTTGGWQLVNEDNVDTPSTTHETVFIGSTEQINGPITVGHKLNIICFGWDSVAGKGYIKVNNSGTQYKTMTVTAIVASGNRRDQAQIAGHNNMDIGFNGEVVEFIVRNDAPTDAKFKALIREILGRVQ